MDDIITALITSLQTNITGWRVVYGDAPQEPDVYLPLISVAPLGTNFVIRGTGGLRDNASEIVITAIVDKKQYYAHSDDLTVSAVQALVNVMEERDATGTPLSTTILGTLNDDLSISGTVGNITDFRLRYDTIPTSRLATATLTFLTTRITPNNC